jgi:hypothetical protein
MKVILETRRVLEMFYYRNVTFFLCLVVQCAPQMTPPSCAGQIKNTIRAKCNMYE